MMWRKDLSEINERIRYISDFIYLNGDMHELADSISRFEWDYAGNAVLLTKEAVENVLNEFLKGKLTKEEVEFWANFLEVRDDVEIGSALKEYVYFLANPDLGYPLDSQSAKSWILEIRATQD